MKARSRAGKILQDGAWADYFWRFAKPVATLLASFGAALLWMAFGPFTIYPPVGYLDPWFYTGYFTNFSYLLLHRGFTYYVSRLPWIIPGRVAFSIVSPELASLLLCAGIVTVSGVSVYWIVRWYYGPAPAIVAALVLTTNAYFVGAAGWQYPDGAAIAYAMVGLALYLRPNGSRTWNGFLAAAALTLSGFTNMAGAPMIFSLLVIPLWRWRHSARELVRQSLCTLAGVAVTTLLLMTVSKSLLGDARVFMPQLEMWLYAARDSAYLSNTWGSGPGFLLTAVRLFTPAFLLVFGPVLLIAVRKPAAPAWPSYLALLICCLAYAFQEFALNRAGLRVHYVSSYMMVFVSCFAGVALGELWKLTQASGRVKATAAVALSVLAVALPFVYGAWRTVAATQRVWVTLAYLGAAAIVLANLARWQRTPLQYVICALVLIAVSAGPAMDSQVASGLGEQRVLHGSNLSNGPRAASFQCLMKFQDYVKPRVDPQKNLLFWWDQDESLANLFTSAEALYVTGHLDLTKQASTGSERLFPANISLVHLTVHPERLAERIRLLAARGVGVEHESRIEMFYAGKQFTVALQDLTMLTGVH